jgi:hypothetical protein
MKIGQKVNVIFNDGIINVEIVLISKNWIRAEHKGMILTISIDKILQ